MGAGWSAAAGLPLANQLFDDPERFIGPHGSDRDVIEAYEKWRREYPESSSEQFIAYAYDGRAEHVVRSLPGSPIFTLSGQLELDLTGGRPTYFGVGWREVAAYLQRRLAAPTVPPRSYGHLRYRAALLRRTPSPEQARFWNELLEDILVRSVVTTNYDLTTEQTIGIRPNAVPGSPGFHYAGIDATVHPVSSPFGRDHSTDPCPSGAIPLAKLHGSLNWSHTRKGLEVFPDLRPAFRDGGDAAIVPPLPEKDVPRWLEPVWDSAQVELGQADEWVVVGYSLPPYDHEITSLFRSCGWRVPRVRIYDPCAESIADRWRAVAPNAVIETFPGLAPAVYGRGGAAGRLSRSEIERRRLRALSDPRVQRMMDPVDRRQNPQHDHEAA